MLNLEPETAGLTSLLIRSGRRTRLLEIGASNGYSAIWLAWAASAASPDASRVTSRTQLWKGNLRPQASP